MKYEVLKGCVIDAKPRQKGEVIEIANGTWYLLAIGRIAPFEEKKIEPVKNRAILEDVQEKPKRTRKPSK